MPLKASQEPAGNSGEASPTPETGGPSGSGPNFADQTNYATANVSTTPGQGLPTGASPPGLQQPFPGSPTAQRRPNIMAPQQPPLNNAPQLFYSVMVPGPHGYPVQQLVPVQAQGPFPMQPVGHSSPAMGYPTTYPASRPLPSKPDGYSSKGKEPERAWQRPRGSQSPTQPFAPASALGFAPEQSSTPYHFQNPVNPFHFASSMPRQPSRTTSPELHHPQLSSTPASMFEQVRMVNALVESMPVKVIFSGKVEENVGDWLENIEATFRRFRVTDDNTKLAVAYGLMDRTACGVVEQWEPREYATWAAFTTKMRLTWARPSAWLQDRVALLSLRQQGSVQHYVDSFCAAANKVSNASEELRVTAFVSGLNRTTSALLYSAMGFRPEKCDWSFADIVELALQAGTQQAALPQSTNAGSKPRTLTVHAMDSRSPSSSSRESRGRNSFPPCEECGKTNHLVKDCFRRMGKEKDKLEQAVKELQQQQQLQLGGEQGKGSGGRE